MLYFRFDWRMEDFKGENHKSVFYGYEAEDRAIDEFENEGAFVQGYYLDEYNKLKEQYFDLEEISAEDYDKKFADLVQEFIKDEWTLEGCSCFELNEDGIDFSDSYRYDNRPIMTIFEGEKTGDGHDGEEVAKCTKILWQGNSREITSIFRDEDIEDKVSAVLEYINK